MRAPVNRRVFSHTDADQITPLISENKIGLTQMNLYATMEISRRYPNVKAILTLTQSMDLHRAWAQEKFDIYTWIKDSVENLLVVKIGKHVGDNDTETASCVFDFIGDIIDEVRAACRLIISRCDARSSALICH